MNSPNPKWLKIRAGVYLDEGLEAHYTHGHYTYVTPETDLFLVFVGSVGNLKIDIKTIEYYEPGRWPSGSATRAICWDRDRQRSILFIYITGLRGYWDLAPAVMKETDNYVKSYEQQRRNEDDPTGIWMGRYTHRPVSNP